MSQELLADRVTYVHVCCHYECRANEVFVEHRTRDRFLWWKKERLTTAQKHHHAIITCYWCDQPARMLDHLWPYYSEMCLCAEHLKLMNDGKFDPFKENTSG